MKGLLIFRLPEEQEEFSMAQDGLKWKVACEDFSNWMRGAIKHSEELPLLPEVREKFFEILSEMGLSLD